MKTKKKVKQIVELFDTKVIQFPLQRQMKWRAIHSHENHRKSINNSSDKKLNLPQSLMAYFNEKAL